MPADTEISWLSPWSPLSAEHSIGLQRELARELGPQHILAGRTARAIAARGDCDDVLFALESGEVAVVHLTWTRSPPEPDPRWPAAALFPSLLDWARTEMLTDHQEFESSELS